MVQLTGSDKQITWAETIRTQAIAQRPAIAAMISEERTQVTGDERFDEDAALLADLMDRAEQEPSASRWIDRRSEGLIGMAMGSATIPERARVRMFIDAYIRQYDL